MQQIEVGQIWRDTYGDKNPRKAPGSPLNSRKVKVLGQEPDGRWRVQNVGGGRINKVKPETLLGGYELQA